MGVKGPRDTVKKEIWQRPNIARAEGTERLP